MATAKNRKTKEKLLSIRLCADGLTFWTTALDSVPDGTGSGYKARPGSDSREQTIAFETGRGSAGSVPADYVRAAAARCAAVTGWAGWPVRVMPDTLKTALVPESLFDPSQITDYLTINGTQASAGERIVLSRLSSDTPPAVVIMACDKAALDGIEAIFGDYVWYTSLFDTATAYAAKNAASKRRKRDSGKCFSTLCLTPANVYITIQNISDGEWVYCETLPYSTPTDVFYYMMELSAKFDILRTPVYVRGTGSDTVAWVLNEKFRKPVCG